MVGENDFFMQIKLHILQHSSFLGPGTIENVPENGQVERVAEKLIANGCKLIFATSYGYLEPILRVAQRHPDVVFMQVGRFSGTKNVGAFFDRPLEPMYIAGVVAGHMTKTNELGFIAAHPVPEVLQTINAFALGARSVNPKTSVKVIWSNTWADPIVESEAARGLIETGADVLNFVQSNPLTIVKLAENKHTFVIFMFGDAHEFAPKYWLVGGAMDWGSFYTKIAKSVINHTWHSEQFNCDMSSGVTTLTPFGPQVPMTVRKEATDLSNKIASKKFVVFKGPIVDRDGKVRLTAGHNPDFDWLAKMNFFVPGVEGNLPK